jgi:hypothetical protein
MDYVASHLRAILEELVDRGFESPLHFVALGKNGSLLAGRYDWWGGLESLRVTVTAQAIPEDGFALPVNLLFVDIDGDAARVVIDRAETGPTLVLLNEHAMA